MTAVKATTMLLEEERKGEKLKDLEEIVPAYSLAAVGRPSCKTCGKNYSGVCWDERPDLVPEWLQEKRGNKRKRTESAEVALAYTF